MQLKTIISVITLFITLVSVGQTIKDGEVLAIIPIGGNQSYCVIKEDNVENYYKTGLYTTGDLTQGQPVQLQFNANGTIKVLAQSLQTTLYCDLIVQGGLNDDWLDFLSDMPVEQNGILFFDDTTQLYLFYEEVERAVDESGQDIDDMLDLLEAQYPYFQSYRTWFNREYDWLYGAFTITEIDEISALDFINDEVQKTFLNESRMIGLGDSVYYFHTSNVILAVHSGYRDGITLMTGLPDGYDVYGVGSVVMADSAVRIISDLYDPGSGPKGVAVVTDSLFYESSPYTENIPCDIFKKTLWVAVAEFWTTPSGLSITPHLGGTLTIDWGDGTPIQTLTNYQSLDVLHTYSTYGAFYPKTTYTFTDMYGGTVTLMDGQGTTGQSISIMVDEACSDADMAVYAQESLGDFLITTKLWVKHNFFFKQLGSYTHAWKKNSSGEWERHKADIYTSVDGIFRDENCFFKKHEEGYDYQHLQKKVQKIKIKTFKNYMMGNGDINSRHWMVKGSTFIELTQTINPC